MPFLVSWPDKLESGQTYDAPVSSLDVMATAIAASGQAMPTDKKYDSVNLIPFLNGENKSAPHDALFWRASSGKARAVRAGSWKLVRLNNQPDELFDLTIDPSETKNLAHERPEIAAQLGSKLKAWEGELIDPVFLGSSVKNEDWGPGGQNQKKQSQTQVTSHKVKRTVVLNCLVYFSRWCAPVR